MRTLRYSITISTIQLFALLPKSVYFYTRYGVMCARDKCMFRHEETAGDVVVLLEKNAVAVKLVDDKDDGNKSVDLDKEQGEDFKDDVEYITEVAIVYDDNDVDEIMVDSAYEVSENVTSSDDEANDKNIERNKYDEENSVRR